MHVTRRYFLQATGAATAYLGVAPFDLVGILAQRLGRTLCKCKEAYHPGEEQFQELVQLYGPETWGKLGVNYGPKFALCRPKGCDTCNNSGYKGRMGLHELLVATDTLKRLIARRGSIDEIRTQAMKEGMTTLLQDGIRKVVGGHLDLKSVKAVCIK